AFVTLKVYDVLGQEVAKLLDHERVDEGESEVEFDGSHLASGVYFYRIQAEGIDGAILNLRGNSVTPVRKMLLTK
ncbi:MAG: T9SS type A sorting domain-containing protein, partial [Ignavibacteriae bacterium]|nr:T9SS type A sorting domain-containing protein [Ignavibacteria bacterium]MBI3363804.1 T9SS type A sorting domain-containing protein [Ignavibacteriota bacterium]